MLAKITLKKPFLSQNLREKIKEKVTYLAAVIVIGLIVFIAALAIGYIIIKLREWRIIK